MGLIHCSASVLRACNNSAEISVCYTRAQLESCQGELASFQKKKKAGMDLLA